MADKPGLLGWFVSNPIAANLLMVVLVIGGLYSIPGLDKQFFPIKLSKERHGKQTENHGSHSYDHIACGLCFKCNFTE